MARGNVRERAVNPHDIVTREYGKIIKDNPGNVEAFYNRGCTHKYKGALESAIRDFNRIIELDPSHSHSYNRKADIYFENGQFKRAIENYLKVIELSNNNQVLALACNKTGEALTAIGEYDKALEYLDRVFALTGPKTLRARLGYYNRGVTYYKKGNYDRSIEDFERVLEIQPKYPYAFYFRGLAYARKSEYRKAVLDFNHAVANSNGIPLMARALYNRGVAYEKLGNFVQASQDYDGALKLNPKDPSSILARASLATHLRLMASPPTPQHSDDS